MAGLTPLPPSIVHSTTRLTHGQAHSLLSDFLAHADIDAAYRPDSTLGERGPQAQSTGSTPNLTLHHLRRILLGMEGKRVAKQAFNEENAAFDGEDEGATATTNRRNKRPFNDDEDEQETSKRRPRVRSAVDADAEEEDGPALVAERSWPHGDAIDSDGDWQAKESYELAQSSDGLELTNEDRHPGATLEQPVDEEQEEELVNVEDERTGEFVDPREHASTVVDKNERKRLKKLRKGAERSNKEETRKDKSKGK